MIQPTGIKIGNGINAAETGDTLTVGISRDAVLAAVKSNAVYSINGKYAAPDGSFFIGGSACDSWVEVAGGTAKGTTDVIDQAVYGGTVGIALVDLCPACTTCDTLFRIKQELEWLDIWVNMMKDVMLHYNEGTGSAVAPVHTGGLDWNKEKLESMRIIGSTVSENCTTSWVPIENMDAKQLLQQYITVVHMWNYAVVQNNASFRIEIAPEDTAGFVVQTKRALPNCDGTWRIRCTVTVSYDHRVLDDGNISMAKQDLSVFIPEPTLWFKPFRMEENGVTVEQAALQTDTEVSIPGSEDTGMTILTEAKVNVIHDQNYTTKTIQTDFIKARVAGTYGLNFKFLPFVNFVMYDKQNHVISVRGGTINITGRTVGDNVYYDFAPDHTSRQPIVAPTKDDYLNAKTAPTASVPFNNVWRVEIKWEIGKPESYEEENLIGFTEIRRTTSSEEGNAVPEITTLVPGSTTFEEALAGYNVPFESESFFEYKETRMYTTTGAREPNNQAIITGSTIPVDVPVTSSTQEPTTT